MKLRKLSAATALLATGALVLSGCTPGGDNGDADGADTGNGETSGNTDAFNAEGQQFTTEPEDTGKADTSDLETMDDEISVSMGEIEFVGYNGSTPESYSVYNSTVVNRIFEGFGYWGTDNVWYANEDFGSYEVVSEDPFTVEYTIGEDVSWSDGTPVTVADYVLDWAYQNASLTNSDDEPLFNGISQTYGERVLEARRAILRARPSPSNTPSPLPTGRSWSTPRSRRMWSPSRATWSSTSWSPRCARRTPTHWSPQPSSGTRAG